MRKLNKGEEMLIGTGEEEEEECVDITWQWVGKKGLLQCFPGEWMKGQCHTLQLRQVTGQRQENREQIVGALVEM